MRSLHCRSVRAVTASAVLALSAMAKTLPAQVAQAVGATDTVLSIAKPRNPMPTEAASKQVTRFSFIAYGDTIEQAWYHGTGRLRLKSKARRGAGA